MKVSLIKDEIVAGMVPVSLLAPNDLFLLYNSYNAIQFLKTYDGNVYMKNGHYHALFFGEHLQRFEVGESRDYRGYCPSQFVSVHRISQAPIFKAA